MNKEIVSPRLLSLDFFRGFIMVCLLLGETGIFSFIAATFNYPVFTFLADEFEHSKWRGLRFWDLLLPAFMLLSGTSMAYSYQRQKELQYTWKQSFTKILIRCWWLLFWGVLIYSVRDLKPNLQFSNVLAQLSFTTLVAFLTIRLPVSWQLFISGLCLLLPELLYRFMHVPGFDMPFTNQHNFGNYIDLVLLGHVNAGYGTTINCIASSGYSIWGLVAGKLLLSAKKPSSKSASLLVFGVALVLIGMALQVTQVTPILKWITTSSFVLVTGGIALIVLSFLYWWIDVGNHRRGLQFFLIVGMNAIFIYLFLIFLSGFLLEHRISPVCVGLLGFINISASFAHVIACLILFALEWFLCFFLYQKKIFLKL